MSFVQDYRSHVTLDGAQEDKQYGFYTQSLKVVGQHSGSERGGESIHMTQKWVVISHYRKVGRQIRKGAGTR